MPTPSVRRPPIRAKGRSLGGTLVLVAAAGALPLVAPAAQAQAGRAALADPPANIPRTPAMETACRNGSSGECEQVVVHAIDRARAAEGLGPLKLPGYYNGLTTARQLFVLADLERVDRGLPGFTGMSSQLDGLAGTGAASNADPIGPAGTSWGSNWAGGEASALLADYDWMYDDGPGSPNLDCGRVTDTGCWDHRQNVLANYGAHPSIGAAATRVNGVTSMTELFSSSAGGVLEFTLRAPA